MAEVKGHCCGTHPLYAGVTQKGFSDASYMRRRNSLPFARDATQP